MNKKKERKKILELNLIVSMEAQTINEFTMWGKNLLCNEFTMLMLYT